MEDEEYEALLGSKNRVGNGKGFERHVVTTQTEADLVNEIGLLFLDAMSVPCVAADYARIVINKVRAFDRRGSFNAD